MHNEVPMNVHDSNNGEYCVSYTPTEAGTKFINIRLYGDDVDDSPYELHVAPGAMERLACKVDRPAKWDCERGRQTSFVAVLVDSADRPTPDPRWADNLTIDVLEEGFNDKAGLVDSLGNGKYRMRFVACGETSAEVH